MVYDNISVVLEDITKKCIFRIKLSIFRIFVLFILSTVSAELNFH